MAFDRTTNKFERMAGGNHQLFFYVTPDTIATASASGYFNLATGELRQLDIIIVIGTSGGTPTIDLLFVTSATGAATVTTSGTEGITATTLTAAEAPAGTVGTGLSGEAAIQPTAHTDAPVPLETQPTFGPDPVEPPPEGGAMSRDPRDTTERENPNKDAKKDKKD
jgi:hypothetical protein